MFYQTLTHNFFSGCWSVRRVPDTSPTPYSFPNSGDRRPRLTLAPLRGGTWVGPAAWPGPALSCFVPLQVVPSRHGRHVGPCRYGTVNLFFGPSTAHGVPA